MPKKKMNNGTKWGKLTIVEELERDKSGHRFVLCKCECGNLKKVRTSQLLVGDTKTCGNCPPTNTFEIKNGVVYGKCCDYTVFCFDEEDIEFVRKFQWHMAKGYIATKSIKPKETKYLHKILLGVEESQLIVDHIDGNPMNNRRSNLRIANAGENSRNRYRGFTSNSGFRGVHRLNSNGRFRARITFEYQQISLGCYDSAIEAAQARDIATKLLFGEFLGRINTVGTPSSKLSHDIYERCKTYMKEY